MSRTTEAFLQRPLLDVAGDPLRLFRVAPNWTRTSWRKDPVSGMWLPGWHGEPARTQLQKYTRAFDSVGPTRVTVPTTDALAPDGTATADLIHEDATAANTHYCALAAAASVTVGDVLSGGVWCKAINRSWLGLGIYTGVATRYAYYNIGSGVVGSKQAQIDAIEIEGPYDSDWYLCKLRHTAEATGVPTLWFFIGEADGDLIFDGLNQDSLYLWGGQLEVGPYLSSHIINDGTGTVQRTADTALILESGLVDGTYQFTALFPLLVPSHTPSGDVGLFNLDDSSNPGTDFCSLWLENGTGRIKAWTAATGGSGGGITGTTNVCDGVLHWACMSMRPGRLVLWVDGHCEGVDTDVDVSDVLNRVSLEPAGAWVGGLHLWPRAYERPPRPVQPQLLTP